MARAPTCFSGPFPPPQCLLPLRLPQDSRSSVLPPPLVLEALWSSLDLPGIWKAKRNNWVWKCQAQSILSWGDLSTSNNYALPVVPHNRKKLGSSSESCGSCQYDFPSLFSHPSCLWKCDNTNREKCAWVLVLQTIQWGLDCICFLRNLGASAPHL